MEILALIPGIAALVVAFTRSPQQALIQVYLPVMLVLPEYYRWVAPGLPDPTFSQATILPIAAAFAARGGLAAWRFSLADGLVMGFAFFVGCSEYLNAGYKEAQNLMFDMLAWVVLPYVLAKGLVEPQGLRVIFVRRLVFLLFCVSAISVYEFKFGATPYRLVLDRFFPWQGMGWVTTFRWGFARVAGPYGHAILAGLILVVGYRLQRWLEWSGHWEPRFRWLPFQPFSKGRMITLGLLGGVLMTMCRGPWMGGALAAAITVVGRARDRRRAVGIVLVLVVVVGLPALIALWTYASVGRAAAKSVSQETAAYRKELIDKYVDIALEHSIWGWGRNTWPKLESMPSIDNYFLLLAMMHGLVALAFLGAVFVAMSVRLFRRGMRGPPQPEGTSLEFTLVGIYAAFGITLATVYMGNQVMPLFFLLTGWAEGYLCQGETVQAAGSPVSLPAPGAFRFRRILG